MNPALSRLDLFVGILRFLATDADEQVKQLIAYRAESKEAPSRIAHVWNPFAEILEGVPKLAPSVSYELPSKAVEAVGEIVCVIDLLSQVEPGYGSLTDDQLKAAVALRLVRRLAKEALVNIEPSSGASISVFVLLSHVAD